MTENGISRREFLGELHVFGELDKNGDDAIQLEEALNGSQKSSKSHLVTDDNPPTLESVKQVLTDAAEHTTESSSRERQEKGNNPSAASACLNLPTCRKISVNG